MRNPVHITLSEMNGKNGSKKLTYSLIMVHLELEQSNEARLRIAANLAEQFQADVIGIAACDPQPPHYAGGSVAQGFVERDRAKIKTRLAECEGHFREALTGRAKDIEWRSAFAAPAEYVACEARTADLVLTGSNRDGPLLDRLWRLDPSDLIMGAGRPVMIVPPEAAWLRLRSILVAWKDTPETRRAVWDALPLLKKAEEVVIAEIIEGGTDRETVMHRVKDVQAWLNQHGVTATSCVPSASGSVPEQLEMLASDFGAQLVVAGAYGHSRWRELVLGGVTRDLITRSPYCSLLSH